MPIKLPSFRARRDAYPADLWTKCPSCEEKLFNKQLDKAMRVCPTCGHHFRLSAAARLEPAPRPGHVRRARRRAPVGRPARLRRPEGLPGPGRGRPGGDRDARRRHLGLRRDRRPPRSRSASWTSGSWAARWARSSARRSPGPPRPPSRRGIPLVVVSASGGARMQEGTLALMQLVKTVAALERLRMAGVPFISIMSDPTTGGVFASFAALGDVNLAEPNALIGFAGARVNAGTIGGELPAGLPARRVPVPPRVRRPGRPSDRAAGRGRGAARLPRAGRLRRPTPSRGNGDAARLPAAVVPDRARRQGHPGGRRGVPGRHRIERRLGRRGRRRRTGVGRVAVAPPGRRTAGRTIRPRTSRRGLGPRPARPEPAPAADARARRRDRRRASSSSTATASSATTRRWSAASPGSTAGGSSSSASRRAPTPRRTSGATSGCPTPRATARRCGSWSWPSGCGSRS